jgi:spore maturation protein SpmA
VPPVGTQAMRQLANVNPTSEHALYLTLFVTNGGGW